MIYTSGTTGVPRRGDHPPQHDAGVGIVAAAVAVGPRPDVVAVAFVGFDVSVWEIFGALLSGTRLLVVPEAVAGSPEDLHDLGHRTGGCDLSHPSAAGMLDSQGLERATLVVAGETCPIEVVDRWAPGRVMLNAYGPTEATIYAAISAPLVPGSRRCRSVCRCPAGSVFRAR